MSRPLPSFFVLVPGPWASPDALSDLSTASGVEVQTGSDTPLAAGGCRLEIVHEDGGFGAAIDWGCDGELPKDIVQKAAATPHAALVEFVGRLDERVQDVVVVGRTLRSLGGVAVRMESSGGASTWEPWLARLGSGGVRDLVRAATLLGQDPDRGCLFVRGMGQFGLPDAEVSGATTAECARWLEVLCGYQVDTAPVLRNGHTIGGPEPIGTRRLVRWPDYRHSPGDGRHNPFGIWQTEPASTPGLEAQATEPVIVPSLVAMLVASERTKGRALTRSEVEALVDGAPTIAMEAKDAQSMERSRGYADLEPRLAWEQWSLVRGRWS